MATDKIVVSAGTGTNVATNTISEDAVTKHIQRTILNDSSGVEQTAIGTVAGAAVVTDANGTIQQYLRGLVKLFVAKVAFVAGAAFDSGTEGQAVTVLQRKTLKRKAGSVNASGDNTLITAVGGKMLKVFAYNLQGNGTVNAKMTDGASGTQLSCLWNLAAGTNVFGGVMPPPDYLFATTAGNALILNLSSGVVVQYEITYTDDDAT